MTSPYNERIIFLHCDGAMSRLCTASSFRQFEAGTGWEWVAIGGPKVPSYSFLVIAGEIVVGN